MDRAAVHAALLRHLRAELDTLLAAARMAAAEATAEESRAENKYDTRSTEASYLARGQAERVASLQAVVAWLAAGPPPSERIGLGSLVHLDDERGPRHYLVAAGGGGTRLTVDSVVWAVVTPRSPLGRAVIGKEAGDEVLLPGDHEAEVVEVA